MSQDADGWNSRLLMAVHVHFAFPSSEGILLFIVFWQYTGAPSLQYSAAEL